MQRFSSRKTFGYEYIEYGIFLVWQANVITMSVFIVGICNLKGKNGDDVKLTLIT